MPLALDISECIHALNYDDIPDEAVAWTRSAFLDTIGVTLAGSTEDAVRLLLATDGIGTAPGNSVILGHGRRTSCLDAALINGTASHALDYDDVCNVLGGHPSVNLVTPLMALCADVPASGRDMILAYVAGFETQCRIARAVHHHHYDKGWHPTSTLGIFGTVAAAARLVQLDVSKTAVALSLAASMASGLKANFGTMTKPLHVGHCTRNGLLAVLLARQGFTANQQAFEHGQGFLNVFNGRGTYAADLICAAWGQPLEILGGEPGWKPFPCCGSTHPAIEATLRIRREHCVDPKEVREITVLTHERRLPHTDKPNPQSGLDAKFSLQYTVARALLDGAVQLEHFEEPAYQEPEVRHLTKLVRLAIHPGIAKDAANQFGVEVIVETLDDRRLTCEINPYPQRGPGGNPLTQEDVRSKFMDCARHHLSDRDIHAVISFFETLEAASSMGTGCDFFDRSLGLN